MGRLYAAGARGSFLPVGKASRILVSALALTLPSCSTSPIDSWWPAQDMFGNVYPVECRRDLSDVQTPDRKPPTILELEPDQMEVIAKARRVEGRLWAVTYNRRLILLDASLTGFARADILHHEQCHVLMGAWHHEVVRRQSAQPPLQIKPSAAPVTRLGKN
jgi:hypothetical protein